jgi:hypothetical protein
MNLNLTREPDDSLKTSPIVGTMLFVVVSEWDGPSFRNPGDASPAEVESIHLTRAGAEAAVVAVRDTYQAMGHEPFMEGEDGDNCDTWAFYVKIVEVPVKP